MTRTQTRQRNSGSVVAVLSVGGGTLDGTRVLPARLVRIRVTVAYAVIVTGVTTALLFLGPQIQGRVIRRASTMSPTLSHGARIGQIGVFDDTRRLRRIDRDGRARSCMPPLPAAPGDGGWR